jgi:hypothetical protein
LIQRLIVSTIFTSGTCSTNRFSVSSGCGSGLGTGSGAGATRAGGELGADDGLAARADVVDGGVLDVGAGRGTGGTLGAGGELDAG